MSKKKGEKRKNIQCSGSLIKNILRISRGLVTCAGTYGYFQTFEDKSGFVQSKKKFLFVFNTR